MSDGMPRRFWANDSGDIYVQEADGRIFELPSGGVMLDGDMLEDGRPYYDGLTEYTPERPSEGLSVEELDALPADSVVIGSDNAACQKQSDTKRWGSYDAAELTSAELVAGYSPVRLMRIAGDQS